MDTWDVAIAGAGPAGAIAALLLARGGARVIVVDKQQFPRDKVCGDGLIPDSLRVLERAGLRIDAYAANKLILYSPSGAAVPIDMRALVIKRMRLDALLIDAAQQAGAVLQHGQVMSVEPGGLRLRDGSLVRARVNVIATGADARLIGQTKPSAVAIRTYIRSKGRIDDLLLSYDRSIVPGYAWIFPLGDGEYNVGCGVRYGQRMDLRAALDRFLRSFAPARMLFDGMQSMEPIAGATLRTGLERRTFVAPNTLVIGESIATTFPLSGEGIGKAMETGELAAQAILRGDLESYPIEVEKLRPRYHGYVEGEKWLARPWLNDMMFRLASRSAFARATLAGVVEETTDPRALLSLRGLLRMLIG